MSRYTLTNCEQFVLITHSRLFFTQHTIRLQVDKNLSPSPPSLNYCYHRIKCLKYTQMWRYQLSVFIINKIFNFFFSLIKIFFENVLYFSPNGEYDFYSTVLFTVFGNGNDFWGVSNQKCNVHKKINKYSIKSHPLQHM